MSSITTDQTMNFTKDLKILYVEDDLKLQSQTKEFFEVLFASVIIAKDGLDALQKYRHEYFDIVISDIKMPNMDGISLCKKIKEINPSQEIIIVSAYNDQKYLLTFINLNIRQFIQKPLNMDNMLKTLYFTAKSIVNEKMVEEYRLSLEESNKELIKTNEELSSLVRILDTKLLQIGKNSNTMDTNINIEIANIKQNDLAELKELEIDINGAAILINLSTNLDFKNIKVLGKMFLSYAIILQKYEIYKELSGHVKCLGNTLNDSPKMFIDRVEDISILLESFIYVLRMWRNNIVNKEIRKALDLHSSMINDINTIRSIVEGTEDENTNEVEFF